MIVSDPAHIETPAVLPREGDGEKIWQRATYLFMQELKIGIIPIFGIASLLLIVFFGVPVRLILIPFVILIVKSIVPRLKMEIVLQSLLAI